jgi:D-3-phosphoglycerate dehydrogenase
VSVPQPLRVLVVGDPYMPVSAYADALAGLKGAGLKGAGPDGLVELSTMQIDDVRFAPPRTDSERRLREYVGDPAEIARAVTGHHVLIVHGAPVTSEVLDAAPLRLVCCARGGPVNVDVAAATNRGIAVVNTPGKNAEAVAELTIAFALLLIRAVPRASRHLLEGGGFAESVFEGREFFGREAPSLTMGLVGLGHVGREVAWRARALGFTVFGYDPQPPAELADVDLVSLETLLDRSDVVSLHARLTPQNRHMFSWDTFTRMRPGSYFINTAREALVDEAALGRALEAGILAGAALDVLERTPPGERHRLLGLPNVIVTPHIGGATAETLARGARRAVAAVADLLAGRLPSDVVNPQVLRTRSTTGSSAT